MRKLSYIGTMFLALGACKKESGNYQRFNGDDYFPVSQGLERIYEVDSVVYTSTKATPDSFHYQVREVLAGSITDLTGQVAHLVQRYTRNSDTAAWVMTETVEIKRTAGDAQIWRNNERLVKLVFPMSKYNVFNANQYNNQEVTQSSYTGINNSWSNSWLGFDSTVQVQIIHDSDFITRKISEERYATGVGLVFGRYINMRKVSLTPERTEGSHILYTLRSYKK